MFRLSRVATSFTRVAASSARLRCSLRIRASRFATSALSAPFSSPSSWLVSAMAASMEQVRAFVWARTARELEAAKANPSAAPESKEASNEYAAAASSSAIVPAADALSMDERRSSNPLFGFGSKLSGVARKSESRRVRSLLAVTKAECQPLSALFSDTPTRQLYLLNGGASCGVSYEQCHALLTQFGPLKRLAMVGLSPFALAEFEQLESAIACEAALDGQEWHRDAPAAGAPTVGGCKGRDEKDRQLFVQFAKMDSSSLLSDGKHPLQLANARPLEEISPASVRSVADLPSLTLEMLSKGVVPGLLLVPDFLSASEESSLLSFLDSSPWEEVRLRHMQHYGFRFNYRVNDVDRNQPLEKKGAAIPMQFTDVLKRMQILGRLDEQQQQQKLQSNTSDAAAASSSSSSSSASASLPFLPYTPDQLTVNRYSAGDGIPAHVDTHSPFTDVIVSISLGATHVMEFVPTSTTKQLLHVSDETVHVPLPPRSLLALTGAARYGYTHAISARRTDRLSNVLTPRGQRTSLTFRQLRSVFPPNDRPVCSCAFSSSCDSSPHQVVGEGAAGADVQLKRRDKSTFGAAATAAPFSTSASSRSFSTSAAAASSASSSASSPPPPVPLSPEIEACHAAACAAGEETYSDPYTGYTVFTRIGLEKARKGVCCGNKCRHCPYQHVNVPAKQNLKANKAK